MDRAVPIESALNAKSLRQSGTKGRSAVPPCFPAQAGLLRSLITGGPATG